jgi:hypothetical protein
MKKINNRPTLVYTIGGLTISIRGRLQCETIQNFTEFREVKSWMKRKVRERAICELCWVMWRACCVMVDYMELQTTPFVNFAESCGELVCVMVDYIRLQTTIINNNVCFLSSLFMTKLALFVVILSLFKGLEGKFYTSLTRTRDKSYHS